MDADATRPSASQGPADQSEHHLFKRSLWPYLRNVHPLVILTSPVIYLCSIPFLLLDLAVTLYQAICFPVYGISKVPRADYLVFDRGRLRYLNLIEKVGCVYCSYANGLLAYVVEIAARTEQHFCPIKHARALLRPHAHYADFVPYGDPRAYRKLVDRIAPAPAAGKQD
jgi:hypothetical protein